MPRLRVIAQAVAHVRNTRTVIRELADVAEAARRKAIEVHAYGGARGQTRVAAMDQLAAKALEMAEGLERSAGAGEAKVQEAEDFLAWAWPRIR